MKKTILFIIISLMLISIVSSVELIGDLPKKSIDPVIEGKLRDYAELTFKPEIKYQDIDFIEYVTSDSTVMIILDIDGKKVKWITSLKNFNEIQK